VPAGSVVVTGSLPKDGGRYNLNAAIIVKKVDAKTRSTTSLNDLLRDQ
jgi:2,3,4,5-tetrahydropyridine-2,6-dicarboxylate N-succinyltransferase